MSVSVSYNGVVLGCASAADGVFPMRFIDELPENSLVFAYAGEGYADIIGIENDAGMRVLIR